MNKHYNIHSIIWDICKRPLYKGELTRKYINECLGMNLPLDFAQFYIKAENGMQAAYYLEEKFGIKMKQWTVCELKLKLGDDLYYKWEVVPQ